MRFVANKTGIGPNFAHDADLRRIGEHFLEPIAEPIGQRHGPPVMWVALNFDFNVSFTGEDDWNCAGCRFRDPEKFIKRLLSQIDTLVHF